MIARTWRGAVRTADAGAYREYMRRTGLAEYRSTPGNRGVWMLDRDRGDDRTEFVMFTLWDDEASIATFAGPDIATARFYPEDDTFLVERDLHADHWRVEGAG
jgi:heme-degrading monooxygenase HmoA